MLKFFKTQTETVKKQSSRIIFGTSNKELGAMVGKTIGLAVTPYFISNSSINSLNILGFNLKSIAACIAGFRLIPGLFANYYSNFGAGIDVITNKGTVPQALYWIYEKCCGKDEVDNETNDENAPGFFRSHFERIKKSNNQELGQMIGMLYGSATAMVLLETLVENLKILGLDIEGPLAYIVVVPLVAGIIANLEGNSGASDDVFFNKGTPLQLLSWLYTEGTNWLKTRCCARELTELPEVELDNSEQSQEATP